MTRTNGYVRSSLLMRRWVEAAAAAVVCWTVPACSPVQGDPPMPDPPPGKRIDVASKFSAAGPDHPGLFVARSTAEARVLHSYLGDQAPQVDYTKQALIAITSGTGCGHAQEVQLYADGDDLALRINVDADVHSDCYRSNALTAMFAVPSAKVPAHPRTKMAARPADLGVGVLVTREEVAVYPPDAPARPFEVPPRRESYDVSGTPDWYEVANTALRAWLKDMGVTSTPDANWLHPPSARGDRRFVFVVPQCGPYRASVHLRPDRTPELSTGQDATCSPTGHDLAVYDVPPA
ncbi:hypothetical protein [Yinghuangia soli]|uniref:Uncharacterized protein n=1 Tax=Yinghuangia soli TaxID=2908204 RepID=A0AA41QA85_9ACTN|nr:hypothetical protein [Yinghuangia soli]MCF2533601.1 hypothetical protein [Yinghuangia soli]